MSLEFKGTYSEFVCSNPRATLRNYLRLLQCITSLVKLVPAYVCSCASKGKTEPSVNPSHSLIYCSVTFAEVMSLYQQATYQCEQSNSHQQSHHLPTHSNLFPELFFTHLLSWRKPVSLLRDMASGL